METAYSNIQISQKEAQQIAKELFLIEANAYALPGELDFNFKLEANDRQFLLKVSRPNANKEELLFQQEMFLWIENSGDKLLSPKIIEDKNGGKISRYKDKNGKERLVRLLTWIPGRLWSSVNPQKEELLFSLGQEAGKLTSCLHNFEHKYAHRIFDWDIAQAEWTKSHLDLFNEEQQKTINYFLHDFTAFQEEYKTLRKSVVHNDVNDNNIIVSEDLIHPQVTSIIDFGDAVYTQTINDLAITIAYAIMNKPDPLQAALPIVKAYHQSFPILEKELTFLYNLVSIQLIITITKSAINKLKEPENEYLLISEKPAWDLLYKWIKCDAEYAHYSFRNACDFTSHPKENAFKKWAEENQCSLSTLFPSIAKNDVHLLDLSVSSTWLGSTSEIADLDLFQYKLVKLQRDFPDKIITGGYLEPRSVYTTAAYGKQGNNGNENRSIHLGIDIWLPSETPIHAPFDGIVETSVYRKGDKEYGGLIILKHKVEDFHFYTLYGHNSFDSIQKIKEGQEVKKGDLIAHLGNYPENGNWATHSHFQIMLSTLKYKDDFPGVAFPKEIDVWESICPDPNLIFSKPELKKKKKDESIELIAYRKTHLGKSLSLSYDQPLQIVRGNGAFLIDKLGNKYLDTVNNVAHVGHEHKRVVKAGQEQMGILNTNTRYLHDNINEFTQELLETFPKELSVVHFVNSGSEANELAIRMCKAWSGEKDMLAVEIGYHGNANACIDVSSYKFDGKGGKGAPEHTHIVPLPDSYRGIYEGEDCGIKYAHHIQEQIESVQAKGRNIAGFICESIISCGGQIELPKDYLKTAYQSVRDAGGLCISDEVQVGVGRIGKSFWGFQLHDVIPDIVTIGKPIGNGHPLAAVVCTREVADAFANGMEYFNTFGGNPVSCAIGREVLRVVKDEKLQENALLVGEHLKSELNQLQKTYSIIGDVRGQGLFLGFELVDENKNPLPKKASYLANRMKELGVLMSTDGKDNNVLKIKPPIVFSKDNADELILKLKLIFAEDFMKKPS